MKTVSVVEAKARFSALLAQVEQGEEIGVTRHGKVIARLSPEHPQMGVEAFRDLWDDGVEIQAPPDLPPEVVASLEG